MHVADIMFRIEAEGDGELVVYCGTVELMRESDTGSSYEYELEWYENTAREGGWVERELTTEERAEKLQFQFAMVLSRLFKDSTLTTLGIRSPTKSTMT